MDVALTRSEIFAIVEIEYLRSSAIPGNLHVRNLDDLIVRLKRRAARHTPAVVLMREGRDER